MLYLCYGKGQFKCKKVSIIPILHKKIQTGLHRVTQEDKILKYWKTFLDYVKTTKCEGLLDDRGVGDAPQIYLRIVETCLRDFARHDSYAFGKNAMTSKYKWCSVPIYKKREAYIAVCRFIFECPEYLQYKTFRWDDFIQRRNLTETFNKRHAPYTTGEESLTLDDPDEWLIEQPKKKRRRTKGTGTVDLSQTELDEGNVGIAEWDSEEGEFVTKS